MAGRLLLRRLVSDLDTPVAAFLKLSARHPDGAFLLESVEGGERLGRYSVIGVRPDARWRTIAGRPELDLGAGFQPADATPIDSLKAFVDAAALPMPDGAPPMAAGVFGYLGYDMIRHVERLSLQTPADGAPDAEFVRPEIVAIFDNLRREIILAAPARATADVDLAEASRRAERRLDDAEADLGVALAERPRAATARAAIAPRSNTDDARYAAMVAAAKERIAAGDIFQAVLSQRFEAPYPGAPFDFYRALRRLNPSPFLFYFNFERMALVGSSPEILVRVRNGMVEIRPIAGTRPRGTDAAADAALERELLADPKERAEHLMLLDLGRNDVGRVAEIGSVAVTEAFSIERYSHVMHIVSNVAGRLRAGVHPVDAVLAGFPAGTVTGAPKIRAMQIIDRLEAAPRGVYGGAVGYFSSGGDVDTCIALRTAVVADGKVRVQAGAGVVADSDPAAEAAECRNKARALFAAVAEAGD